jgi:calcineurin-like phosphoesterase family protein
MDVWFTADLHLGHGNIIKYCNRPFMTPEEAERARCDPRGKWRVSAETVQRHDDTLIDTLNMCVEKKDVVWIVGDFCMGGLHEARMYRNRIRCQTVYLVWGNHDHRAVASVFTDAVEQCMYTIDNQDVWLNHYPLRTWNRRFHGSWHVYGHVHGRLQAEDAADDSSLTRDVGVDACDYRPISFGELQEYMKPRMEKFRQAKEAMQRGEGDDLV